MPEDERHALVICGVKIDFIDAIAEAVEGLELRQVAIRLARKQRHALAADDGPVGR